MTQGYLRATEANAADALYAMAYLANLHIWSCCAGISGNCGINQIYWSLSLEEQCYLILSVTLFIFGRRKFAVFLIAVIATQVFIPRPSLSLGWFLRTDALALGALIALATAGGRTATIEPKLLKSRALAIMTLVASVATVGFLAGAWKTFPQHTAGIAVVSALLVWLASYGKSYLGVSGIGYRPWAYVGSRSYALYFAHVPVYYLSRPMASHAGFFPEASNLAAGLYLVAALGVVFILAELNYRLVELPLRFYGRSVAARWASRRNALQCAYQLERSP